MDKKDNPIAVGLCFYFGCKGEAGHYLFADTGRAIYNDNALPDDFPLQWQVLDGGLLPPKQPEIQGRASLIHIYGWTILTFWDRSVDKRGKCNSSFVLPGIRQFQEAKHIAELKFPWVWLRFDFKVYPSH